MPTGFASYTDNGTVQIDESYSCMSFISKATVTATIQYPQALTNYAKYIDISYTGTQPIIAFYIAPVSSGYQPAVCCISVTKSGNNWVFRCLVTGQSSGATSYSFTYYIFDIPPVSTSGPGLLIYDAAGGVVFNSNNKVLQVSGFNSPGTVINTSRVYAAAFHGFFNFVSSVEVLTTGGYITSESTDCNFVHSITGGVNLVNRLIYGYAGSGAGSGYTSGIGLNGWGSESPLLAIDITGL